MGRQRADLAFEPIVRGTNSLVLVSLHLDSVALMKPAEALSLRAPLPAEVTGMCAFFRAWCLVELAEALRARKPVVMLIGELDPSGAFVLRTEMVRRP